MEIVPNWQKLQQQLRNVSRGAIDYSTSLYASPSQIDQWCLAGSIRTMVTDETVLVLRTERDFQRIYHVTSNVQSLTEKLRNLPTGRYVADLVGRHSSIKVPRAAYEASGFRLHSTLCRMVRAKSHVLLPSGSADRAHSNDVMAVELFLERLLDPLSEQLPTVEELNKAAEEGRLLIVKHDAVLAGMLMYDLQEKLAHLRFWHVDPTAQGLGVGRDLMGSFLSECGDNRRVVLWVIGDNARAIAIYDRYGFTFDGLLDHIMISDKD